MAHTINNLFRKSRNFEQIWQRPSESSVLRHVLAKWTAAQKRSTWLHCTDFYYKPDEICSDKKVAWIGIRSLRTVATWVGFQDPLVGELIDFLKTLMLILPVLCILEKRQTCWVKLELTRSDLRDSVSISLTMMSHEFHVVRMNSGDTTITVFNEFFNPYRMLCKIQGTGWTPQTPVSPSLTS